MTRITYTTHLGLYCITHTRYGTIVRRRYSPSLAKLLA